MYTSVIITILVRHIPYALSIAIIIGAIFNLSYAIYVAQKKPKRLHVFIKVLVKLGGKGWEFSGYSTTNIPYTVKHACTHPERPFTTYIHLSTFQLPGTWSRVHYIE